MATSPYNLVRNTRVFFTTNVDANTGVIPTSGASISSTNTFEILVQDGFSFSQGTQQTTISLMEGGNTPTRGSRAFNDALDPVEFSFVTYIRPRLSTTVYADESVLWNALFSSDAIDSTGLSLASTTLSRAASSATATVIHTAANYTAAGLAEGSIINVTGVSGTDAHEWNMPASIVSFAPSATACTTVTIAYATAPAGAGTAPVSAPTSLNLRKGAWVSLPATGSKAAYTLATMAGSNKNQLQKFGIYFAVDGIIYAVDNCCLDTAAIDFDLQGIGQVTWTGKGTALRSLPSTAVLSGSPAVFSGAGNATGTAAAVASTANFITNKLSTLSLEANVHGGGTSYAIALTGGNITISNNITYLTPAILGVVNKPIGYFTGNRSITGNITAYLKTGSNTSAQLLADTLAASTSETKFRMQVEVGGATSATRLELEMDGCMLQIPTVNTGDVMSTQINFTAQGQDATIASNAYDLSATNDLAIRYFSA